MKKFKIVFVAALLATISSFAFAEYRGSIQLRMGYGIEKPDITINSGYTLVDGETSYSGGAFVCSLANYNTWLLLPDTLDDLIGLGFVVDGTTALGPCMECSYIIGPAVSVKWNNILKVYLGAGVNIGLFILSDYKTQDSDGDIRKHEKPYPGIGFGLDCNVVFFPEAVFSPLIGMTFGTLNGSPSSASSTKVTSFKFYLGGSFNLGR